MPPLLPRINNYQEQEKGNQKMSNFIELGISEALAAVLTKQNIESPMQVQAAVIPKVLGGGNLVAQAPTGTGKTLAYLLPVLQKIDTDSRDVQAVILAPTYELAMQITNVARDLSQGAGLGLKVQGLIGGANIARQMDKLKDKPQLIVGSAGRIIELAQKNKLKLHKVKMLVLDELSFVALLLVIKTMSASVLTSGTSFSPLVYVCASTKDSIFS
jgi:superfamily II DNA/RNA helicase